MRWYTGELVYDTVLAAAFVFAFFVIVGAAFVKAPYGRFADKKWGLSLDPRVGWFLMELPATLSYLWFYFHGSRRWEPTSLVFLAIWLGHYANRGFVFPALLRVPKGSTSSFGLLVVCTGWLVTSVHGYLNARFVSELGGHLVSGWLTDPRFLVGIVLYYTGFAINIHADAIVRNLRSHEEVASGQKTYRIPVGGLFRWVTNPSYFGELLAWSGFALFHWSLGALFVLGVSLGNLVPRAFQTHRWYREKFPEYPKERKVLVPFLL